MQIDPITKIGNKMIDHYSRTKDDRIHLDPEEPHWSIFALAAILVLGGFYVVMYILMSLWG